MTGHCSCPWQGKVRIPVVTEVMDIGSIEVTSRMPTASRSGRAISKLPAPQEVGKTEKPVLLKSGMSTTSRSSSCRPSMSWPEATAGYPVRTRYTHIRNRHAQYARHFGRPGAQGKDPSPRHRDPSHVPAMPAMSRPCPMPPLQPGRTVS